jgi:hypothetical protein
MRSSVTRLTVSCAVLLAGTALLGAGGAKSKVFVGVVGDTLCSSKHSMPDESDLDCIKECLGKGGGYSLIIGEKVYALETEDPKILGTLEKEATKKVKVTGEEKGDKIEVTAVKPAS